MAAGARGVRLGVILASFVGVALGWVEAAGAEQPPARTKARFEYTRGPQAEACPREGALRAAVAARLGYDPFDDEADNAVVVALTRSGDSLRADVELRRADGQVGGTRTLHSDEGDCTEIAAATALAISIAVDPQSAAAPAADDGVEVSRPAPAPRRDADRVEPRRPVRASSTQRQGPHAVVSAGPLMALGSAPAPAFGVAVQGALRWPAISLGLEGRADLPASQELEARGEVSTMLIVASILPCLHHGVAFACAAVSAGALRGTSSGISQPEEATTPFAAAGARAGVELPVSSRVALRGHAELEATLTRTTLHVGPSRAWTSPPICGALGTAVVASFP